MVSKEAPKNFTLNETDRIKSFYYNVFVDMNTNKAYFEPGVCGFAYICGANTDGRTPTFADYKDFKDARIEHAGGIVNIPAGKFDISYVDGLNNHLNSNIHDVVFDENGMDIVDYTKDYYGFSDKNLKCADWAGGDIIYTNSGIADVAKLDKIYCGEKALTRQGTSKVFKGSVPFAGDGSAYLYFSLLPGTGENARKNIFLGCDAFWYYGTLIGINTFADNQPSHTIRMSSNLYTASEYDCTLTGLNSFVLGTVGVDFTEDATSSAEMTAQARATASDYTDKPVLASEFNLNHVYNKVMITYDPKTGMLMFKSIDTAGVEDVAIETADGEIEYYTIQGVRVTRPATGFYIKRQGSKVTKILVK